MSWVTYSTVVPAVFRLASRSSMRPPVSLSRFPVGSSPTTSFGSQASARAMRHPLLLAPRQLERQVVALVPQADGVEVAAGPARTARAPSTAGRSPSATPAFSRAVKVGRSWKNWNTIPTVWPRHRASRSSLIGSQVGAVHEHLARGGTVDPGDHVQDRRLPATGRPHHGHHLARPRSQG